jgi:hypothetical protein
MAPGPPQADLCRPLGGQLFDIDPEAEFPLADSDNAGNGEQVLLVLVLNLVHRLAADVLASFMGFASLDGDAALGLFSDSNPREWPAPVAQSLPVNS